MVCLFQEELEVLQSIYDGDDNFQKIDGKTFQYTVCVYYDVCLFYGCTYVRK